MAKEQPASKKEQTPVDRVTLDEFCARLSETEKRYTLIAGFHAVETKRRALRDTASAYQRRFDAFLNQPA